MRDVGCPSGLRELGYDESDVDDLVSGAMKQQRLLAVAPMEVEPGELAEVVGESLDLW